MSKYVIDSSTLTSIADAVRTKGGTTDPIVVSDIPTAITNLPSGGGGDLPEEAFVLSGDCSYRFANNGWNWFLNEYGDRVTTSDITNATSMFEGYSLSEIPFDINLGISPSICADIFSASSIKKLPYIKGKVINLSNLFYYCKYLREIPNDWADYIDFSNIHNSSISEGYLRGFCCGSYSIRKIPNNLLSQLWSKVSYSRILYYQGFNFCYSLDEITNIPMNGANLTSNSFSSFCNSCSRIKNMTFAIQDNGTPYNINWKKQVIDLISYVGYVDNKNYILSYNSGITADKEVKDDASYQLLKNDPDWFTCDVNYSRYNHDSAVATINSLPDTSAYLATAGGTNTIKFKGQAGALTDGGAINTLTESEIAVATAKGWTCSFV